MDPGLRPYFSAGEKLAPCGFVQWFHCTGYKAAIFFGIKLFFGLKLFQQIADTDNEIRVSSVF
jgi:hypothetical protein